MSILRHQDSMVSVETQKNKNFCWAACIEMITAKYNKGLINKDLQCNLAKRQVDLLKVASNVKFRRNINFNFDSCRNCSSLGDTALYRGENLYQTLFKELCQIDCAQFELQGFPDWRFIEDQTSQGSAVIFSGIYIPSCPGASHAVVVTGTFLERNQSGQYIHWVLANDPYVPNPCQSQQARKTAWIYDELRNRHRDTSTANGNADRSLIYVADFKAAGSEMSESKSPTKLNSISSLDGAYPLFAPDDLKNQVESLLNSLFGDGESSFLYNYFGFGEQQPLTTKGLIKFRSIDGGEMFSKENGLVELNNVGDLNIATSQDSLESAKQDTGLSKLPVYQGDRHIINIYIQHELDTERLRIVGIEEHQLTDMLSEAEVGPGDQKVSFDKENSNFSLLDIAPFGFQFQVFEKEGKTFTAPIFDYNSIKVKKGKALPLEQLMENVSTAVKGYDADNKPKPDNK